MHKVGQLSKSINIGQPNIDRLPQDLWIQIRIRNKKKKVNTSIHP